jgi:hypothetical protein
VVQAGTVDFCADLLRKRDYFGILMAYIQGGAYHAT